MTSIRKHSGHQQSDYQSQNAAEFIRQHHQSKRMAELEKQYKQLEQKRRQIYEQNLLKKKNLEKTSNADSRSSLGLKKNSYVSNQGTFGVPHISTIKKYFPEYKADLQGKDSPSPMQYD